MSKSSRTAYKKLLRKAIQESPYKDDLQQRSFIESPEFVQMCHKFDFNICRELLCDGHSVKAIQEALIEYSLYGKLFDKNISSKRACMNIYCDEILENIKKDKVFHSGKTFELVQEQYIKSVSAIKYKYENYKLSEFNEAHIVLVLLRQGYLPDMILKAMLIHSPNKHLGKDYFKRIIMSCIQANKRYNQIFSDKYADNPYIKLAKNYLINNKMHILNKAAEVWIVTSLFSSMSEADIRSILLKFSPVAIEPGRSSDAIYIEDTIRKAKITYQKNLEIESKNYDKTLEEYQQQVEKYNTELEYNGLKSININRPFYDGKIIKDMLANGFFENNLIRVLKEHSPHFFHGTPLDEFSTAEEYAKYILVCAKKTLSRENMIKDYKYDELMSNNYESLRSKGISPEDIYKSIINNHIRTNPNTALRLTDRYIDIDACEIIRSKYPDVTREGLISILENNSPRFAMPGISEDYAANLVDRYILGHEAEIAKRNSIEQQRRNNAAAICMNLTEEVNNSFKENDLIKYHSCRAALLMMQNGISDGEIRENLAETIQNLKYTLEENTDDRFIQEIIDGAHNVKKRLDNIQNCPSDSELNECAAFYLKSMYDLCEQKYASMDADNKIIDVTDNMDIHVIMKMKNAHFKDADIQNVISQMSPVAAELGRDENYSKYIIQKTEQRIEQEQMKLSNYICIPRYNKEKSADAEYRYQREQLLKDIYLPFEPQMDKIIAGILLAEGFSKREIQDCISQESELSMSANYAKTLIHQAEEMINLQNELEDDIGLCIAGPELTAQNDWREKI